ncbi:MAG: PCI domain-containing protein [Methanobacteriota archaeon]
MPGKPSAKASLWHMDSEVYLLPGGFVLGMAVMMILLTNATGAGSVLAALCVPIGVVPGAIAVGYGLIVRSWESKARKYEEALRALAAYVKPYRRIPLNDLAANTGRTRMQAEQMLGDAIDRGYLRGVIDRSAQEFVVQEAVPHQVLVERCPHCGGDVNRWSFPEESFTCPYCDRAVAAPGARSSHEPLRRPLRP